MSNQWNVAVVGLGYVGLPLAVHMAGKGLYVQGFDKDTRKIKLLNEAKSYIPDVEGTEIAQLAKRSIINFSTPNEDIGKADYIVVAVPTPLDARSNPDLRFVISASVFIAKHLREGQTVIFESSTYPGTIEEVVLPILSRTGMKAGEHYYLGYSPERIDPGNRNYMLEQIPKVISGLTDNCKEKVKQLYELLFESVVPVSSTKVAELCKLFENIQRLVNISLVNEMELMCRKMNIDFHEVLSAASTKPFGFTPYWPGPGIGGHCIPVDPLYFQWKAKQFGLRSHMIEAAYKINRKMPAEIVQRVSQLLESSTVSNERKRTVLIIGLTYKKDVNDMRESTALEIFHQLAEKKYAVEYCDPYVSDIVISGRRYVSRVLTANLIRQHDVVLILTDHSDIDWQLIRTYAKRVIDTRGVLSSVAERRRTV